MQDRTTHRQGIRLSEERLQNQVKIGAFADSAVMAAVGHLLPGAASASWSSGGA
jgi:hypothetical protein